MIDLSNVDASRDAQPWFIYKRITLNQPINYFLEPIDYGFWYILRRINVKYPEVDAAGAVFFGDLRLERLERASGKWVQNAPIPFRLISTPHKEGVQINAASQMTATPLKNSLLQNVFHPYRDNIEIMISGQVPGVMPLIIDICLLGYYVSAKERVMWEGEKKDA